MDKELEKLAHTDYDIVNINDYCDFKRGTSVTKKDVTEGEIPVIAGGQKVAYYHNVANRPANTITVSSSGAYAGFVNYHNQPIFASDCFTIAPKKEYELDVKYLFHILKSRQEEIYSYQEGGGQPHIYPKHFDNWEIPLPPLEIQQQIVAEIEGYQKIIDGAKQVVNNYKPTISINPDWEMATLDELCDFIDYRGKTPTKTESGVRLITAKNVRKGYIDIDPQEFIGFDDYDNVMTRGIPRKGDVLFTTEAPLGNVAFFDLDERISLAQRIILLRPKHKNLLSRFLVQALLDSNTQSRIENYASGSTVLRIKQSSLREIEIPVPQIEHQELIVKAIEEELQLVNANKRLVEIFEQKIKTKIGEVWGVKEEETLSMAAETQTEYNK
jgi:restriction endonuclease S subunit